MQTLAVILLACAALVFLVRTFQKAFSTKGCGGACGCEGHAIKAASKR